MAKINVLNNSMAMFLLCETIAEETDEWKDVQSDENGMYEVNIQLNGREINVERFIENMHASYQEAVKKQASDLLRSEYEKVLASIYDIQETLENHNKLFEKKVYGISEKMCSSDEEKANPVAADEHFNVDENNNIESLIEELIDARKASLGNCNCPYWYKTRPCEEYGDDCSVCKEDYFSKMKDDLLEKYTV